MLNIRIISVSKYNRLLWIFFHVEKQINMIVDQDMGLGTSVLRCEGSQIFIRQYK